MAELLIPKIWIEKEAFDQADPEEIILSVGDFVEWASEECLLADEEYPVEARLSRSVDVYGCQVANGGHLCFGRYIDLSPGILAKTKAGLSATSPLAELQALMSSAVFLPPAIFLLMWFLNKITRVCRRKWRALIES